MYCLYEMFLSTMSILKGNESLCIFLFTNERGRVGLEKITNGPGRVGI